MMPTLVSNDDGSSLPQILKQIFNLGVDIHDNDDEGRTPLHLAVKYNRYQFAKQLIARGADVMVSRSRVNVCLKCQVLLSHISKFLNDKF